MKLFVGAIFIMSVIGGASASIISRGFFDEAMKNYALKTDVGDVTALQSKIGTLPTGTVRWLNNYMPLHCDIPGICMTDITLPTDIGGLLSLLYSDDKDAPSVTNLLDMMINGFLYGPDYIDGFCALNARLSSLEDKTYLGLEEINTKVKATELPSDTDDGQYVLTAKKINRNITYTWVKMDLTDSEK